MEILYLDNSKINFVRWDNCINNSINGSVFVYSWYLNIICENWSALISSDYEYVMPILHLSKYKKDIIFTSKLGNRHGVFSNQLITEDIVKKFVTKLPKSFSIINILLNKFNKLTEKGAARNSTYELDLIQTYHQITKKYSNPFQKHIHIAVSKRIDIVKGLMPNELIAFAHQKNVISKPKLRKSEFDKLRLIIAQGLRYNLVEIHGAYSEKNTLVAAVVFLKSKQKTHVLYSSTNNIEEYTYPLHYLIDKFIETHAEKNLTLNLENIITKNDLDFFTGVGAHEYTYKQYLVNNLPWYYKLLIKIE